MDNNQSNVADYPDISRIKDLERRNNELRNAVIKISNARFRSALLNRNAGRECGEIMWSWNAEDLPKGPNEIK